MMDVHATFTITMMDVHATFTPVMQVLPEAIEMSCSRASSSQFRRIFSYLTSQFPTVSDSDRFVDRRRTRTSSRLGGDRERSEELLSPWDPEALRRRSERGATRRFGGSRRSYVRNKKRT